jgi:hypothetical protein
MNEQRIESSRIDQTVSFLMMLAIVMLGLSVAALIAFAAAVKIALTIWS